MVEVVQRVLLIQVEMVKTEVQQVVDMGVVVVLELEDLEILHL